MAEIFSINSDKFYRIPKYQREYTWGLDDGDALFNDVTDNEHGYFLGSYICVNSGFLNGTILEVIDGQQRFKGNELISKRDLQDYLGRYQDLRDEWKRKRQESTDITDDVVFEIELIRQIEINIDYILMLVKKYHDTHCEDKEVLITINKAIDASPELRSKKQLIETFITGINDVDDVMNEWHEFVVEQRDHDLNAIITEEKLKPEDTRKFMENAFRDGEIKTAGTDIDKLMPPISRFGGGGRAKKKQGVIDKLKTFFEKYFGIGGSSTFTEPEHKTVKYSLDEQNTLSMVAESKIPYGNE